MQGFSIQILHFCCKVEVKKKTTWLVKMEYCTLKYLTINIVCYCVISMQMFDLDSGALAILLNDFCSVLVL